MTKEERLLNDGLDFNMLYIIRTPPDSLIDNVRVRGWVELVKRKGYIDEQGELTQKGIDIKELFSGVYEQSTVEGITKFIETEAVKEQPFNKWVKELYGKLQGILLEKTGKKQKVIDGKYSFLCNEVDLGNRFKVVIHKYKIKDLKKCEKVMIAYVNACIKANFDKTTLVFYYLMKDGYSKFMTDYDGFTEEEEAVTFKGGVDV